MLNNVNHARLVVDLFIVGDGLFTDVKLDRDRPIAFTRIKRIFTKIKQVIGFPCRGYSTCCQEGIKKSAIKN
jgi:hypothetical protein